MKGVCIASLASLFFSLATAEENPSKMDPESQTFLDFFNAVPQPPLEQTPIKQVRELVETRAYISNVQLGSIQDLSIPGPHGEIPIRIYTPEGKGPFSVFVFYHGGGWVFGKECHCRCEITSCTISPYS